MDFTEVAYFTLLAGVITLIAPSITMALGPPFPDILANL